MNASSREPAVAGFRSQAAESAAPIGTVCASQRNRLNALLPLNASRARSAPSRSTPRTLYACGSPPKRDSRFSKSSPNRLRALRPRLHHRRRKDSPLIRVGMMRTALGSSGASTTAFSGTSQLRATDASHATARQKRSTRASARPTARSARCARRCTS